MQLKKRFPGRFDSLGKISLFIKKATNKAGLDDNQAYAVELAVDEACSNIIEHAYGEENIGDILCICQIDRDGLTIILKDKGKPFNPDAVPEVDTTLGLDERSPGGAGVFLMRKVMDSVRFEFKSKENVLTMVKKK